ncbi:MAG: GAF domain-containing protein [Bacteroidetes bacterium]|nr:GAF domain-containing protein [Bacteroidota bacterium]
MIEQIQQFFKDSHKVNRLVTVCFFGFLLLAVYFLATLKYDLVFKGGMIDSHRADFVFTRLFIVIGLVFTFSYLALHYTRLSKKEVIVYLDKKLEDTNTSSQKADGAHTSGHFSVAILREKIKEAKSKEEKWQAALNNICHQLNAGQGALYQLEKDKSLNLSYGFAVVLNEDEATPSFQSGEGLIGQVAATAKSLYLDELPEGYAARIGSGLGNALPKYLFIFPVKKENNVLGVIEIATFSALSEAVKKQVEEGTGILSEI